MASYYRETKEKGEHACRNKSFQGLKVIINACIIIKTTGSSRGDSSVCKDSMMCFWLRGLRNKDANLLKEMRVILSKLELLVISEDSEREFCLV